MKRDTSRTKGRRDATKAATIGRDAAIALPANQTPSAPVDPLDVPTIVEARAVPHDVSASIPVEEPSVSLVEPTASTDEPSADPPVGDAEVPGSAGPPPSPVGRRGQIQAAKARFDLGPQQRILSEALGELPPGYGLTHCSAWVRDPRHVIAVWDINSTDQTERGDELGWERVAVRLLDGGGNVLRQIPVARRSGIWHIAVPNPGESVRIAVGFALGDGRFETVARSHYVQLPHAEAGRDSVGETARLPVELDRRTLLRAEPPPRPGFGSGGQESPGWRLHQRIRISRRSTSPESWLGPFRKEWDAGVAPPPRIVIEPEPEPSSDDEQHSPQRSDVGTENGHMAAASSRQSGANSSRTGESASPSDRGAADSSQARPSQAGGDAAQAPRRLDAVSPLRASRPYENLPSPISRGGLPGEPKGPLQESSTKPYSVPAGETSRSHEPIRNPTQESMSSPRGGFGKPRPERT
ncbi:MAG: DUF4912 domain-containing protein [Acidobacteriota bacterium]